MSGYNLGLTIQAAVIEFRSLGILCPNKGVREYVPEYLHKNQKVWPVSFLFFLSFWPHRDQGSNLHPLQWKLSLNQWTAGEVPSGKFLFYRRWLTGLTPCELNLWLKRVYSTVPASPSKWIPLGIPLGSIFNVLIAQNARDENESLTWNCAFSWNLLSN